MIASLSKKSLHILAGLVLLLLPTSSFAFVPLICDLCTIGVVAGLALSRKMGLDDSVVGVWIGALIVVLITMTNAYMEKKNWKFKFRDTIIAISYIVFIAWSFKYFNVIGNIGMDPHTFFDTTSIFADKIVVSSIVGAIVLIGSAMFYQWLKSKNNGRAHFPFEKVVVPISMLSIVSAIFYFITSK